MTSTAPSGPSASYDPRPVRSAVVYNPARVDGLERRRHAVDAALAAAGWPAPVWVETTPEDPGTGQARRAAEDGAELVFACGGDGTVRACVEGLAGGEAALAILPAGTGNLLATNLGVPDDPAAAVRLATEGGRRRIDVGEVDGQAFAVMAGMGFDAAMLDDAPSGVKRVLGPVAYVFSALRHLRGRHMHLRIELDGGPALERRARSVVVGNVGRLQAGVQLLTEAEPDDGTLDVAVMTPRTVGHWAALLWGVLRRRDHVDHFEVHRASGVRVTADRENPRELDGDVIAPGRTLEVVLRPRALQLCVPRPEWSRDLAEGAERLQR
ncbi:diacylglycerol kinase family protein [Quadrisphaera sp. INWT6]|uniref:diacylglycerol/lipid kinase family protein n=1 Tax=Quadrisphaera sp. INWT6 TaxID=2596917 RepID=UPI001892167F|nr:diacylglycerol kinase family protein [Quadrisphaera sp. INWT6]